MLIIKRLLRIIEAQDKMMIFYLLGKRVPEGTMDVMDKKAKWVESAKKILKACER